MESQTGANPHESEPYSYLCLDSSWDTIKRGGPWGANDLGVLNALHGDFNEVHNLMEIMMRFVYIKCYFIHLNDIHTYTIINMPMMVYYIFKKVEVYQSLTFYIGLG